MFRGPPLKQSGPVQASSPKDGEAKGGRRPAWLGGAVLLGFGALLILFGFTDLGQLGRVLAGASPIHLALPLLCVAASYITMALSYYGIARAAGGAISFADMLRITLVANSLNYLLATGGLSGFAARMYYFTKRSIPPSTAVVISLVQTFLTNMSLLAFILLGFGYVLTKRDLSGVALASTATMVGAFIVAAILSTLLLFHQPLRRWVLSVIARLAHTALRKVRPKTHFTLVAMQRYIATLERGIQFLLSRKAKMAAPLFFILLDWLLTILILQTSFAALRYDIPFSQTVVGFSVGIILSFVSLIPGGLGVMEGSMAAIFKGMGVPFETAVAAVLLFRVIYYILPLAVSIVFLRDMIDQVRSSDTKPR